MKASLCQFLDQARLAPQFLKQRKVFTTQLLNLLQGRRLRSKIRFMRQGFNVITVSAHQMRELNRQYRGKNKSTDVLSFPWSQEILGEIFICAETVRMQSREHKLSFEEEYFYVLLHGVLHLLGYDHEPTLTQRQKHQAKVMFKIQDEVFDSWRQLRQPL